MNAPFNLVACHNNRNFVAMQNPKLILYRPKSKVPFNNDETLPQMRSKLIDMFSKQNSAVIDQFSENVPA